MKTYPVRLREELAHLDSSGLVDPDTVFSLYMFTLYIVNLAEDGGWVYDGHSFKCGDPLGVLTVRAHVENAPMVCFVNGRTMQECMGIFVRWCELGEFRWYPDKYRVS